MTLSSSLPAASSRQSNPFELSYRTPPLEDNPFEKTKPQPLPLSATESPLPELTPQSRNFFGLLALLLALAIVLTLLRSYFLKALGALSRESSFHLLYREMTGRGIGPYLILYLFFAANMGIFLQVSFPQFSAGLGGTARPASQLLLLIPSLLLLARHFFLTLLGTIFPFRQSLDQYQFLMVIFGIAMGFLLAPANIFFPYLSEAVRESVILTCTGIAAGLLLFHYVRALSLASKYLSTHFFHFMLYVCTVEFAPILVMLKWMNLSL